MLARMRLASPARTVSGTARRVSGTSARSSTSGCQSALRVHEGEPSDRAPSRNRPLPWRSSPARSCSSSSADLCGGHPSRRLPIDPAIAVALERLPERLRLPSEQRRRHTPNQRAPRLSPSGSGRPARNESGPSRCRAQRRKSSPPACLTTQNAARKT
jgi:hypothetical protein